MATADPIHVSVEKRDEGPPGGPASRTGGCRPEQSSQRRSTLRQDHGSRTESRLVGLGHLVAELVAIVEGVAPGPASEQLLGRARIQASALT